MDNMIYEKSEFSWEDFKAGKTAVWCETEELRKDFLLQCDDNGISWGSGAKCFSKVDVISDKGEENTSYDFLFNNSLGYCYYQWHQKKGLKVVKWEINKVYKGWEIIKVISEGKLRGGTKLKDDDGDSYTVLNGCLVNGIHTKFDSDYETESSFIIDGIFTIMERKKYTFAEAFKVYEQGEEIEDKWGMRYRKSEDGNIEYKVDHMKTWERVNNSCNMFSIEQIRNEWYINN